MDIDSSLLRTLVVTADEGHVGRAAARLGISQQAASQRLARLGRQLGAPVIERTGRGFAVTALGNDVLPQARTIVEQVDLLASYAGPETRTLRIDVLDEHLSMLRFVIEQTHRHRASGDQRVEAVMRKTATIEGFLRSGDADLCFGRPGPLGRPAPPDLVLGTPVLEPIALVVGRSHPWFARESITAAELREVPLWFPMTGAPQEWRDLLDELGSEFEATIDFSGSTMGIEQFLSDLSQQPVASFWAAGMPPPPGDLRVIPVVHPVPVFAWFPVWRRGRDRAVRTLAESIVERARRAISEPDVTDAWLPAADRAYLT